MTNFIKADTDKTNNLPADGDLWKRFQSGDASALFELYKRLYVPLVNYGINLSNDKLLAQDTFSDLMISLWDKRASLTEVKNVKAYLMTALKHQLYADLKFKDNYVEITDAHGEQESSYEEVIINSQEKEELRKTLRSAFSKLTPRQTQFITMRFYEGLSYQEIADLSGVDIKAVYNKVYEGIKILRQELPEKFVHLPDFFIFLIILGLTSLN
jgi:RNA polymerase sigma factor (sigma-70 family)